MSSRYESPPDRKKMLILRGISGSGKTTLAREQLVGDAVLCSADDFFMQGGSYAFDPKKLPDAHAECLRKAIEACQAGMRNVIVDNTSTTVAEVAPYVALGQAYGYAVEILTVTCPPEVCAARNTHGVPLEGCKRMAERLEAETPRFPPWWKHRVMNGRY